MGMGHCKEYKNFRSRATKVITTACPAIVYSQSDEYNLKFRTKKRDMM